jgi:hypothetical protein
MALQSCIALFEGELDCGTKNYDYERCVTAACGTCPPEAESTELKECGAKARATTCAWAYAAKSPCGTVLSSHPKFAAARDTCEGKDTEESLQKMGAYFCGTAP